MGFGWLSLLFSLISSLTSSTSSPRLGRPELEKNWLKIIQFNKALTSTDGRTTAILVSALLCFAVQCGALESVASYTATPLNEVQICVYRSPDVTSNLVSDDITTTIKIIIKIIIISNK
jgi:hypothetical protein